MSKLYFKYHSNGNLENVTTEGNHLYQGMVGIADYHLSMADPEDVNNILPSDLVLLCFERPDGRKASCKMFYSAEAAEWVVTTNGWETDVDITNGAELKVSIEARRYSTVSGNTMVRKFTSEQVVILIQQSHLYAPLDIPEPIVDGILNDLAQLNADVGSLQGEIDGLESSKLDKMTEPEGKVYAYTHYGAEQGQIRIESDSEPGSIVQRDAYGQISVPPAPMNAYDAVSAVFVTNEFNDYVFSQRGEPNGIATLDEGGKIPSAQLPSYVDDVIEVANFAALPLTGESGKIYVTLDTNLTYRWSGSAYVEISKSLALGETSTTAYQGDRGKELYDFTSPAFESGQTLQDKLDFKADKTELITPWSAGTVVDNAFTANCNDKSNYILNNSQDVALTILGAYNGAHMLVAVHGGVALTLPPECVTDVAFDWTTVEDDSQYYIYEFVYNGNKWEVTRNVYNETA